MHCFFWVRVSIFNEVLKIWFKKAIFRHGLRCGLLERSPFVIKIYCGSCSKPFYLWLQCFRVSFFVMEHGKKFATFKSEEGIFKSVLFDMYLNKATQSPASTCKLVTLSLGMWSISYVLDFLDSFSDRSKKRCKVQLIFSALSCHWECFFYKDIRYAARTKLTRTYLLSTVWRWKTPILL